MQHLLRIVFLVALFLCKNCIAQKEYNMWYFGLNAGLNFNTSSPSVLLNSKMASIQSSSSICDSNGNLLFYTDGDTVWNRNHVMMLNGKTSKPNLRHESAVQGSLILPVPFSKNLYFIIMGPSYESISTDSMMNYWIVDMTKDGGLGAVLVKEMPLFSKPSEGMAVTRHANGYDYWVAAICDPSATFRSIRSVNGQFTGPVLEQKIDVSMGANEHDYKFSPNSQILSAHANLYSSVNRERYLSLFRFDNNTGLISQRIKLPRSINQIQNYVEFSPNSRFLYVQDRGNVDNVLWQYDLSVWDSTSIVDSKTEIYRISKNIRGNDLRGLQIAPDGKIYAFNALSSKISVIDSPDLKGIACAFRTQIIDISPGANFLGGPYYPSFMLKEQGHFLGANKTICVGDSVRIGYHWKAGDTIVWNTGDTSAYIHVKKAGTYVVKINGVGADSVKVFVFPKFKVYLGSDTAFCGKFSHILKAGSGFKTYNWNTGEKTTEVSVNSKGVYAVKVTDSNNCANGDTINVDQLKKPSIQLNQDSINCKYVFLSIDSVSGINYYWSTGETGKSIQVSKIGSISITASNQFCAISDTVQVTVLPMPIVDLGKDTAYCGSGFFKTFFANEMGKYLWSTGSNRDSIHVKSAGVYSLSISRNNCTATDSIKIIEYRIPKVNLGLDTTVCYEMELLTQDSGKYLWSTSSNSSKIKVNQTGYYWLKETWGFCSDIDTVFVQIIQPKKTNIGSDTTFCSNSMVLKANTIGKYLWNTGEISQSIRVYKAGLYSVKVQDGPCFSSDTVIVDTCMKLKFYIPNVFTPNADGVNDVFKVFGEHIASVQMEIYNRWGEKLLVCNAMDAFWDGKYKDTECQESVYFYSIKIIDSQLGQHHYFSGTLQLLR